MKKFGWIRLVVLPFLLGAIHSSGQDVLINEIMYHPQSENALEEFVELYNPALTNVALDGWTVSGGVTYQFSSNITINAGGYLVVAANTNAFRAKYPGVANVVGNWVGLLSNNRNRIEIEDAQGRRVDMVEYADEGEWAVRQRGPFSSAHRGWEWDAPHDGFGKSLELINPALPNQYGQNWAPSGPVNGTPGTANFVKSGNIPPMILEVSHTPIIPTSGSPIIIRCRIVDEQTANLTVQLFWRIDSGAPPPFTQVYMNDDGMTGDGGPNDGVYGAILNPLPDDTLVEYYVQATDAQLLTRTWPAPARTEGGSFAQVVNALFQVENDAYTGQAPLFRFLMTTAEYQFLAEIFNQDPGSDASANATFIVQDGTGVSVRPLVGIRNRGHGSRSGNPHNYRIGLRSDEPWNDRTAINLNARQPYVQHLGSTLALKAGVAGASSIAVQLRVNNGPGPGGTPTYNHYAANEALNSDWAERHFPEDDGGNIYKVIRDIDPPNFDYRGTDPASYMNTYFKESNVSENDWSDLIGMLQIMGENSGSLLTTEAARSVANVNQWLLHIAVMCMFANNESGLFTGNNDDYFMYRGLVDPRFILLYHDLDQIMGVGSLGNLTDIFRPATCCPISGDSEGTWRAMNRIMHWPDFEPIYYVTLQQLIDTVFSKTEYDLLVDQTLGFYVPSNIRNSFKIWMDGRRSYVQSVIAPNLPPAGGFATISGEPRSPTWMNSATLLVGGTGITSYRYRLNNSIFGGEIPVGNPINLANLLHGSTNSVQVLGRSSNGAWQDESKPTISKMWLVDTNLARVRLNEVLAHNVSAVNHQETFPDIIELFNEWITPFDVGGMQLTDDPAVPGKFVFPSPTMIGPRSFLVIYADDPNGTLGLHSGFSLDQTGEGVYLFDSVARGGRLLDSVEFGNQLPNVSMGRSGTGGRWLLFQPSPNSTNMAMIATSDPSGLSLNEWLAAEQPPGSEDFIELYNPSASPVDLGGLFLTDTPISLPFRHAFRQNTYVPGQGFLAFIADGNADNPTHLNFGLDANTGTIALNNQLGQTLDYVAYGPQRNGVSTGRCPNGGTDILAQAIPTPGTGNACPSPPPPDILVPYIAGDHVWRYDQSGANLGTNWISTNYNDSVWPQGQAILANETCGCTPDPIRTTLTWLNPAQITFYFRSTFNFTPNPNLARVQFDYAIDDGAVFYLNGREIHRYNLQAGPIDYLTRAATVSDANAYQSPITIPLNQLLPGQNWVAVEVHNNQTTANDLVFGMRVSGIIVSNTPARSGVLINEVLANNTGYLQDSDGSSPDLIELYNPGTNAVTLAGYHLTDNLMDPARYMFQAGTVVPLKGFLVFRCDGGKPASATNSGFGLDANGDSLYLLGPAPLYEIIDTLTFGLQVPDFSLGRVPDGTTNLVLTLTTFGETNLTAALGNPGLLKINEWMAAPASGDDWFEIYNPNALPVAVGGFYLSDDPTDYTISRIWDYSFIGSQTNAWQKFIADGNEQNGADHVDFSLRSSGESMALYWPDGSQIHAVTFFQQALGTSEGFFPDGSDHKEPFPSTPSPGESNFLPLTHVVVNEVLTHTDLPLEDAIELRNLAPTNVNIGGWWLSDARSKPLKYQIPPGTTLPGNGYRVFYENRFNSGDFASVPFSLSSAKGDEVHLNAAIGGVPNGFRHSTEFGASFNGVAIGRYNTSIGVDFVPLTQRTFGHDSPTSVEDFRMGQGLPNAGPRVGPVAITEIMYHPQLLGGLDNVRDEFVELHNLTPAPLPLYDTQFPTNTWRIRKGVDYDFPPATILAANGYILLVSFNPQTNVTDRAAFEARYGTNLVLFGPYDGKLDNGGEEIEIQRPDTPQSVPGPDFGFVPYVQIERIAYQDMAPWPVGGDGDGKSLQRLQDNAYGNDPVNWFTALPTPQPGTSESSDSDGDGMPNAWEVLHDTDPGVHDAADDPDHDGMTNIEEYLAGTHPNNPNSFLKLELVAKTPTQTSFQFNAVAGKTYAVLSSPTMAPGSWQTVTTIPAQATTQMITVYDNTVTGITQRFYVLVTPAP